MKELATQLIIQLGQAGFDAMFAGGCVRDELLGLIPKDWDIATTATPDQVAEIFPHALPIGKSFGVMVVPHNGFNFEIATLRGDGKYLDGRRPESVEFKKSFLADAARRDFTINSMFQDPITGHVIDFFGGKEDLKNSQLVAVGDPLERFQEDHLRILRAVRFASRLGFMIEPKTARAMIQSRKLLAKVSAERIRDEFLKILKGNHRLGLKMLFDFELLEFIIPELIPLASCMQDSIHHPEGTVWQHTMMVIDNLKSQFADDDLLMAGLLHDIAKPQTREVKIVDGREKVSHINHDEIGAEMSKEICQRLRLPNASTNKIVELVRVHMQAHDMNKVKKAKLIAFLRNPFIEDIAKLQHADSMGTGCDFTHRSNKSNLNFFSDMLLEHGEIISSTPIVNGQLLKEFGLNPGPNFKRIMEICRKGQDNGRIIDKQSAMNFVKSIINNPGFET